MLRTRLALVVVVLAIQVAGAPLAFGGETTGRSLVDEAHRLTQTTRKWSDRTQRLKLKIVDRHGGERNRQMVINVKKYPEDRSRSIVFFEAPADVKGVGMLQWTDPKGKDEQWLYLPELKRVRQVAGAAKRESFVGTDFSYEDLAIVTQILDWTDTEARVTLLRDEELEGQSFHVLELVPAGKDLSYGKVLAWLRASDLLILRFEMQDQAGQGLKVLSLSDVRLLGNIPTPFRMEMSNQQTGSRTSIEFTEIKYDTGLDDQAFTQRALEHGL